MSVTVNTSRLRLAATALACLAVLSAHAAKPPHYHLAPVSSSQGESDWSAINASGLTAGWSIFAGDQRAAVLKDGVATPLDTTADVDSEATALNGAGDIVGFTISSDPYTWTPVKWGADGSVTKLAGGFAQVAAATGINDAGQITINDSGTAWLWHDGKLKQLPTLGGSLTDANAINAKGWITGRSTTAEGVGHAFVYKNGTMTDIGTLGLNAEGRAINAAGHVAGISYFGATIASQHPFWWDGSALHDLGSLGGKGALALGINAHDVIVGNSARKGSTVRHAFVYTGGRMYDLNTLLDESGAGWELVVAEGVNDAGQIVGRGQFSGAMQGFVLTPVAP